MVDYNINSVIVYDIILECNNYITLHITLLIVYIYNNKMIC